jgi:hypothetical protein
VVLTMGPRGRQEIGEGQIETPGDDNRWGSHSLTLALTSGVQTWSGVDIERSLERDVCIHFPSFVAFPKGGRTWDGLLSTHIL